MTDSPQCYCGRLLPYESCCKPYLIGKNKPLRAEDLMRSRYTAFCLKKINYLNKTSAKSAKTYFKLITDLPEYQWTRLEIIKCTAGTENDLFGTVEFKAFYRYQNTDDMCLWEVSDFEKIQGEWCYVNGLLV